MSALRQRLAPPEPIDTSAKWELSPPAFGIAGRIVGGAVVSSFLFGYSICVLNSCGQLIAVTFEWCGNNWQTDCIASRGAQGFVNASLYLGAAFGALSSGRSWVSECGCRLQLVIADVYFAVGALMCMSAQGIGLLIVGRFASGLGLGVSAIAAPLYMAEISPRERRGIFSAMHGVFITLGLLASIAFGIPQDPPPSGPGQTVAGLNNWYWRVLLGFPLLLAISQAVYFTVIFRVDPPNLLIKRGETRRARDVLYRIYGMIASEQVMMADSKNEATLELQLRDLVEAVETAKSAPRIKVVQALRDPFLRTAVLLGGGLAAFQQLCGINGLMSYSNLLFGEAGIPPKMLTLASTMMSSANVCASIFSSKVVDRWGRRKLLLTGSFIQTMSMVILTFLLSEAGSSMLPAGFTGPAAVVIFTIFVMSFSFGLGAVTWVYLSEIYPIEIRGPSLSACGIINWLSSFVVVFGTRFLSLSEACSVFGTVCFVGFIGTYTWVIETKGCSMDDSPLTPKSGRRSSTLLSPGLQPPKDGAYTKMEDSDDDDESDSRAHMRP